ETGNRERLTIAQLELGLRAAGRERRDPEAVQNDRVSEVERADFRPHLQMNAVADDRRREVQADAELLEHDRDAQLVARALRDRQREFAAGEEAGFLAALGDEVRLGEALEETAGLQRSNRGAEVVLLAEEEQIQEVADAELAFGGGDVVAEIQTVLRPLLVGP